MKQPSPALAVMELPHTHAGARAGGITILIHHEEGEISLVETDRKRLESDEPLATDLTFGPELPLYLARNALTGNREVITGVNGAYRIMAAAIIAQAKTIERLRDGDGVAGE